LDLPSQVDPPSASALAPLNGGVSPSYSSNSQGFGRKTVYLDYIGIQNLWISHRKSEFTEGFWKRPVSHEVSWVQLVKGFDELRALNVVRCRTIWDKWVCEHGHVVVKPMLCGDRLTCPICAERYADERVKHVMDDFKALETFGKAKLYLISIVFSFPKELWDRILEDPDLAYRCVYEALNGLKKEMPSWFVDGEIGGVARLHLWSSSRVFELQPHVHVVVPNRVLKNNGRLKYLKRIRPWFTNKNLRFRWKLAIEKVFGVKVDGEVNVHVSYVNVEKNKGRAIHVLRYVFRQFVYDVFRKGLENDRRVLDDEDVKGFVHKLLEIESSKHLVRYFGFLASNGKAWINSVREVEGMDEGLDDGLIYDDEEAKCPVCGGKIVNVDRVLWFDLFDDG